MPRPRTAADRTRPDTEDFIESHAPVVAARTFSHDLAAVDARASKGARNHAPEFRARAVMRPHADVAAVVRVDHTRPAAFEMFAQVVATVPAAALTALVMPFHADTAPARRVLQAAVPFAASQS